MRKFLQSHAIDPETFELIIKLVEKYDDGTIVPISERRLVGTESKYTLQEQADIDRVNQTLRECGIDIMTGEETDYMLDPSGMVKYGEHAIKNDSNREMQELAGFVVEKTVRYTNE
jgi:hypothetical protein